MLTEFLMHRYWYNSQVKAQCWIPRVCLLFYILCDRSFAATKGVISLKHLASNIQVWLSIQTPTSHNTLFAFLVDVISNSCQLNPTVYYRMLHTSFLLLNNSTSASEILFKFASLIIITAALVMVHSLHNQPLVLTEANWKQGCKYFNWFVYKSQPRKKLAIICNVMQ